MSNAGGVGDGMRMEATGFESRLLSSAPDPASVMIDVRCNDTGDWAEAPDEYAALFAARTLLEDARSAYPIQGFDPTATILVDGKPVLNNITRRMLWAAIGSERRKRGEI